MTYAAWALFAVAALTDWHAVFHGNKRLETIAKPATLIALILVALSLGAWDGVSAHLANVSELVDFDGTPTSYATFSFDVPAGLVGHGVGHADVHYAGRWLLFALAFGLLGDIALLGDSVSRFKLGLGAFLIGHLGYLVCFSELGLPRPGWSWAVFAVLLLTVIWTQDVTPSVYRSGGIALAGPVVAYTLVIAAMFVLAWFTGDWVIALGATIFVASDSILSVNRFVRPLPQAQLAIMVTYHVGQALIVAGVLGWT